MAFLTDQISATGVNLTDLFHIVNPYDVSQGNPAGSSYKACFQQVIAALTGGTSIMVVSSGVGSVERCANDNEASGNYSTVSGGLCNTSSDLYSTTSGGYKNTTMGQSSVIGGGEFNMVSGSCSSVVGGILNTSLNVFSNIGGGSGNTVDSSYGSVLGGVLNTASGYITTIGGGNKNTINGGWSSISGGYFNTSEGVYSVIAGGIGNYVDNTGCGNFLGGGVNNTTGSVYSAIGGGLLNTAIGGCGTFVFGGCCNLAGATMSFIGGGESNTNYALNGGIVGGAGNFVQGLNSSVVGGAGNYVDSSFSMIGSGSANKIDTPFLGCNFIGGGICNTICGLPTGSSTILGGRSNKMSGISSIIAGGCGNTVNSCFSNILGGNTNTVTQNYTSIVGGSGNTLTHSYSSAVGLGVYSVSACTFHVNYLGLQNTPSSDTSNTNFLVRDTSTGVVKTRDISLPLNFSTSAITSSQTLTWDNAYWGVSGSSNVDLILPTTTSKDGYYLLIKDEAGTSGSYRIRLTPSSGLIDGNSYVDMNINYMSLTVMVRNGNWYII